MSIILRIMSIAAVMIFSALESKQLKVLHITFHEGCKNDFEDVARELNLDLTSWFVQHLPKDFWEGHASGNEIYNVGSRRAKRIWDRHHTTFEQFDLIVTSDTAPLSRIFLQHNWQKPLIIWVCNRFDYAHGNGGEDRFPDAAYYELIRQATKMNNVRIVSYTPFEHEYARRKGINIGTRTIKPLGKKEELFDSNNSAVPSSIIKQDTLFIFPRLDAGQLQRALKECRSRGLKVWSGVYRGPEDLKGFKGVILFPYAFSNLALFENLQRGIVHFVPTQRFLEQLGFIRDGMHGNLNWSEWYFNEYKDYFIFFDSWSELANRVASTPYEEMKRGIRLFGEHHRYQMLNEWQKLIDELIPPQN